MAPPLNPTQKKAVRYLIRRYCEIAEQTKATKHYRMFRPMNHLGKNPASEWTADCSGFITGAFRWADLKLQLLIKDPNGLNYKGWGNSATLLSYNRKGRVPLDRKFFVGDIAIYGSSLSNTKHVAVCRKDGNAAESIWTSHGSEGGPYAVRLMYRTDLLIVVRTEQLR